MKAAVIASAVLIAAVFVMLLQLLPELALAVDLFLLCFASLNLAFVLKYESSPKSELVPNPKDVAVIIPVKDDPSLFNSIPYAKNQDYPGNSRVLVVDDSLDEGLKKRIDSLADEKCTILRRDSKVGRKAGAINFALEALRAAPPSFVVVLDSDHRMPKDFLSRAVALIEKKKVKCVVGYQKHSIGSFGPFGVFYRLSQAMGIITMKSRSTLGLAPIFGGSCSIFDYAWLDSARFDETSVTEDWELTIRGYLEAGLTLVVREDLYADAAVPQNLKWFFRQQARWYEGTISDFLKHGLRIPGSKSLTRRQKAGLYYSGLMYFQAIAVVFSLLVLLSHAGSLFAWFGLGTAIFSGVSYVSLVIRAAVLENVGIISTAGAVVFGFAVVYVLAFVMSYTIVRAVLFRPSGWDVTRRRG